MFFVPLQNARHHAVAGEFPDRRRSARCDLAGDAVCVARPQALDCVRGTSGDMRVFATWKSGALSSGNRDSRRGTPRRAHLTALSSSADRSTRIFPLRMIRLPFTSAAGRLIEAAVLAHRYPNARIIFSGGSANLISADAREADYAAAMFESLGVSRERLTMERRSRNTQENAEFSKVIAAPKSGERWLLVTSAYHMPRSVGLFRKAGFAVEPYPVDWRTGKPADILAFSPIAVEGLERIGHRHPRMDRPCRLLGHRQDRRLVARTSPKLAAPVATGEQSG